jgi:hypothetical protein
VTLGVLLMCFPLFSQANFVASTAALIATGWSEPVPGRVYPAVDQRLHGAHENTVLSGVDFL